MRTLIRLLPLLLLVNNLFAQQLPNERKSSAYLYFEQLVERSAPSLSALQKITPIVKNQKGLECIRLMILTDDRFLEKDIHAIGGQINSTINNSISVTIPVQNFHLLEEIPGIQYLELDQLLSPVLDSALLLTNTLGVHTASCTPSAYKGSGVVIGIIDFGFDYSHPAFLSLDGTRLRIKRVWNQAISSGIPPNGYSYGSELIDSVAIMSHAIDSNFTFRIPHGTLVAGCAAGSGYGTPIPLSGTAPDTDIVLVSSGQAAPGTIGFIDAINYIFNYANAVGKPTVVNMSFSTASGPHDGSSYLSRLLDELPRAGKLIIASAGNAGNDTAHIKHTFFSDTIKTINVLPFPVKTEIDIWGESGNNFFVKLEILDSLSTVVESTTFIDCTNGTITPSVTRASIRITKTLNHFISNKPNFNIIVDSIATGNYVRINLTAESGTVHLWNGNGKFHNTTPHFSALPNHKIGDAEYSIGDFAGACHNVLSVGAFTSKQSYTNLQGDVHTQGYIQHNLADFSSRGPTVDGRTKPDITAPGTYIFCPSSHVYPIYSSLTSETAVATQNYLGTDYFYNAVSGTSFSAPIVAGIVALMLENDPSLTIDELKFYLRNYSKSDEFTEVLPNNKWGNGKIDACAIIQAMLGITATKYDISKTTIRLFPNPVSNILTLSSNTSIDKVQLRVFDFTGKLHLSKAVALPCDLSVATLPPGIYFTQLTYNGNSILHKFIKH